MTIEKATVGYITQPLMEVVVDAPIRKVVSDHFRFDEVEVTNLQPRRREVVTRQVCRGTLPVSACVINLGGDAPSYHELDDFILSSGHEPLVIEEVEVLREMPEVEPIFRFAEQRQVDRLRPRVVSYKRLCFLCMGSTLVGKHKGQVVEVFPALTRERHDWKGSVYDIDLRHISTSVPHQAWIIPVTPLVVPG